MTKREEYARIIDPRRWEIADWINGRHDAAELNRRRKVADVPTSDELVARSLSKADAIIGLENGKPASREVADFLTEIAAFAPTLPNYAEWDISLPAGHWRAIAGLLTLPASELSPDRGEEETSR